MITKMKASAIHYLEELKDNNIDTRPKQAYEINLEAITNMCKMSKYEPEHCAYNYKVPGFTTSDTKDLDSPSCPVL